MSDWFDKAKELYIPGKFGYKRIAKELGLSHKTVESRFLNAKRRGELNATEKQEFDLQEEILNDIKKGTTVKSICEKYKISERVANATIEDIKEEGYTVTQTGKEIYLKRVADIEENKHEANWKGNKIIRFAVCGDNQDNSKYTQITHLHTFYDMVKKEGIDTVYHTGDIDEGEQMRTGHQYECYAQGADDHVKNICKNYPKREGIDTYFITGNHDHSIIKRCGYDIGYAINQRRDDMHYLGMSNAMINLTPNCKLELRHPLDGTAYAISYKTQKMIDAMQGGEKPNILCIGHYHKAEYLFYRNIHAFQTGCFQAQTPWMKGKQLAACVGGWIIEIHVEDDGTIRRCKGEFIPFYNMIKDDYKNWL